MSKLALKVGEHGASRYRGGKFHFTADITKDGRARRTTVQPNLATWIEHYPLTADALNPTNYYRYAKFAPGSRFPTTDCARVRREMRLHRRGDIGIR